MKDLIVTGMILYGAAFILMALVVFGKPIFGLVAQLVRAAGS
jgi:hypothetical protein